MTRSNPRHVAICLAALAVFSNGVSLLRAEHTQKWTAKSEADFKRGDTKNLVLTTQGQLRLSREIKTLLADDPQLDAVLAMAEGPDGTLYVGGVGGAKARVLAVKDGKSRVLTELAEGELISAMVLDKGGRLLVATSGEQARVVRVATESAAASGAATTGPATVPATMPTDADVVFSVEDVQYIWAMAVAEDGTLYLTTGPEGKLFALKAGSGEAEVVFDSESDNLTCIAIAKDGRIYLGSDPEGRVYRFDPATQKGFIVFDAAESEITSLVFDAAGNLYAATGATGVASTPEGAGEDTGGKRGRPDPLSPEKPEPDLPEPPMTPPEPAPKKDGKSAEDIAAAFRFPALARQVDTQVPIPNQLLAALARVPASTEPPPSEGESEGSAVYRIDKEGFVSEVFRAPVTIYAMAEHDGVLLLGTGASGAVPTGEDGETDNSGVIYEVDLRRDEMGQIARATGKDVSALLVRKDGSVAVGVSNGGAIAQLSSGLAPEGVYISEVLDATAVARLGAMRLEGSLPTGATLTVATRSGNTDEPSEEGWNAWTAEVPAAHFLKVSSPPARYFQYRLTFKPGGGNVPISASVREAEVSYQLPNVAPKIRSLTVAGDPPPEPAAAHTTDTLTAASATRVITWEAEDANTDALEYTLQYRPIDAPDWRVLKEKLTEPTFTWNTQTVPDGRYELRLVASDANDNAPGSEKTTARVSDIVLVDNSPPTISAVTTTSPPATAPADGKGRSATLKFNVRDAAGAIAGVWYRVDGADTFLAATAADRLFDSPSEDVTITVADLKPGKHYVYIKATDERGNPAFATVPLDIPQ